MNNIMDKMKWFIVATLSIIVVGMTLLGIFGFNNTIDYGEGFEVRVRLEQETDEDIAKLKTTADKYFSSNSIAILSAQIEDQGAGVIYKLTSELSDDTITGLKTAISDKIASTNNVEVTVSNTYKTNYLQPVNVIIAYTASLVVVFLYMLIMNKLASAVSVIFSSILSVIVYLSVMAIVRIPAAPFVEIMAMISGALSAVLSVIIVGEYREKLKSANKATAQEIAVSVAQSSAKKFLYAIVAILLASFALIALLSTYTAIMGASLLIAGLTAVAISYFATPFIWTAIKGKKSK